MTDRALVLHHGGCPDGFGSAYLMHRYLTSLGRPAPEIVGCNYNEPMPDVADRVVYIVDFCFEPDDLRRLENTSSNFVILDHHATAEEWIQEAFGVGYNARMPDTWVDDEGLVVLDKSRSGIGLVKGYTGRNLNYPHFVPDWVDHIEDRDLWRFQLKDTPEVFAWATSFPYTVEAYDDLEKEWETNPSECRAMGIAIQRYRERLVDQIVADAEDITIPEASGWTLAVPAPYAIGSDVAGMLATLSDSCVGAYYIPKPGGTVRFGLRSTPDGPNVAKIAELFGGGGHEHAAGFEVPCDVGHDVEVAIEEALMRAEEERANG